MFIVLNTKIMVGGVLSCGGEALVVLKIKSNLGGKGSLIRIKMA